LYRPPVISLSIESGWQPREDDPVRLTSRLAEEHLLVTRRHFLHCGAAGMAALVGLPKGIPLAAEEGALEAAVEQMQFLTPAEDFGTVERGDPLPYTLPEEKRREVGLERETWRLEVLADPASNSEVERPMTVADGTALDWDGLMRLAERHAVRFLKVMTCNNGNSPLGMGLWEGVPLREVVWLARPTGNVRRLFYHGYHNDDPEQLFQSSLSIGRVLEDPPGDHPVVLCYQLNGAPLSGKRGGPVRMLVPDAYGFKSVKWLTRVFLTNNHQANDTYADGNNDIDSWMKTFARFVNPPAKAVAGEAIPLAGLAQVGVSGLAKVQVWIHPRDEAWPEDDPYFTRAEWRDAAVLPPPERWGGGLADGRLPVETRDIDPATSRPSAWPLRNTIAHWAVLAPGLPEGRYDLRCRTIDSNGIAQPLPRPFPKSGRNAIESVPLTVAAG
jgi:DMSO/TMAO reductase YedYZ molybdopterin-dependent catalytic subunit